MKTFASTMAAIAAVAIAGAGSAEPLPVVDVTTPEAKAPRRVVAIEWNPLSAIALQRWSANVVIVPVDHHALIISPFYTKVTTNPIYVPVNDCTNRTDGPCAGVGPGLGTGTFVQVPDQTFRGFGGEIGYRNYSGRGGPRGFFWGPSLILGGFTATPKVGDKTSFMSFGVALDVGWQILVGDDVSIALGVGVQYTRATTSLPPQQYPAEVIANSGVRPRFLFSLGWAF